MDIFDLLQREGVVVFGAVNERRLASLPFSQVIDIADRISYRSIDVPRQLSHSPYVHSASLGLGGSPDECMSLECRVRRISELARYAALYSDGVFVHNFFSDYSSTHGHAPEHDSEEFRMRVADDIRVILTVRSLVEAGVITLFTPRILSPDEHLCNSCFANLIFGVEAGQRFIKARDELARRYLECTSIEAFREDEYYYFDCKASDSLLEHGSVILYGQSLPEMNCIPRIRSRIDRGNQVALSRKACEKLNLHRELASGPAQSVIYHAAAATALETSFLTHRQLDIDILRSVSYDHANEERNALLARHAQAVVPFAADVPIEGLLELRKREEEAFARFQAAIHRTIAQVRSEKNEFTERDARMIYGDIIRPTIAELEQKVHESKRDLVRKPVSTIIGTMAVLGFGLFSGVLTTELKSVVQAVGLLKVGLDVAANTVELDDVQRSIRRDDMYFLWRVKQMRQKR